MLNKGINLDNNCMKIPLIRGIIVLLQRKKLIHYVNND
jgi:hypothetical protein